MSDYRAVFKDGFWNNNVTLVQILGLCPTIALTGSATNGLGMGLATTVVFALSNVIIASLRNVISDQVRIPVFIVLIATLVTLMDMAINAWMHELYKVLGLFIALIVANCAVLGRAEAFAQKNTALASLVDGLAIGFGFTMSLTFIGAVREIIGAGTLFANASGLLGEHFRFLEMTILPEYRGFLLAALPPGGFLALGFILAFKRAMARRAERTAAVTAPAQA